MITLRKGKKVKVKESVTILLSVKELTIIIGTLCINQDYLIK